MRNQAVYACNHLWIDEDRILFIINDQCLTGCHVLSIFRLENIDCMKRVKDISSEMNREKVQLITVY